MNGRTGKTKNIILVWLVWPLITLGIYHLVWYYKINREARDFDERTNASPWVSVLAVTFGAVLIVPPFVSVYKTGSRIAQMQRAAGMEATCSPVIGCILLIVFSLHSLYYQNEANRIWAHYGNPEEDTEVPLAA